MPEDKAASKVRRRLRDDFEFYADKCLKILKKPDRYGVSALAPFKFNSAQKYIHARLEEQRERLGYVRAIILKGRQQGASTYVEGRFYWKTTNNEGQKTYILTHKTEATDNLFAMVDRYHQNAPPFVRPFVGKSNAKEMEFSRLDSKYQVATAGAKGAGRSATLINVHGSEVAYWENAPTHLSGMLQAVPLAAGTEVILESTANGVGNVFHTQWKMAEIGDGDFIAIFVPWFWQDEYRRPTLDDFELLDDPESVPEGELTEAEYAAAYNLDDDQMFWRRGKIIELGGGEDGFTSFKQEYPATPDEAFQASRAGDSLIKRKFVVKARKSTVATEGQLIIGVDPGGEGDGGDPTAIVRRRTRRMYNPQLFTKLNTMQIAILVQKIIKAEKPYRVYIDVGGLGIGIFDRLMELEGTHGIVVAVNFGEAAYDVDRYVNRRAEMHWAMKDWLEDPGGANIPDKDEFEADLLASVIAPSDSNQRRQLRSKVWMRSKGIPSPNLADAGALTFAEPINVAVNAGGQTGQSYQDFDPLDYAGGGGGMIGNSTADFDPTSF